VKKPVTIWIVAVLYFVYSVSLLLIAGWGYAVWQVAARGWPYPDIPSTVISLLPGILLVLLSAGSSIAVFRYFRALPSRT
jgi:hypothetical protein